MGALREDAARGHVGLAGAWAGRRVLHLGGRIEAEDLAAPAGPRCAFAAGVSVHADVVIPARDRQRIERMGGSGCLFATQASDPTFPQLLIKGGYVD